MLDKQGWLQFPGAIVTVTASLGRAQGRKPELSSQPGFLAQLGLCLCIIWNILSCLWAIWRHGREEGGAGTSNLQDNFQL